MSSLDKLNIRAGSKDDQIIRIKAEKTNHVMEEWQNRDFDRSIDHDFPLAFALAYNKSFNLLRKMIEDGEINPNYSKNISPTSGKGLLDFLIDTDKPYNYIVTDEEKKFVRFLIINGYSINIVDYSGVMPLRTILVDYYDSPEQYYKLIIPLLSEDEINHKSKEGLTAIFESAMYGNLNKDVMELMVKYGARLDVYGNDETDLLWHLMNHEKIEEISYFFEILPDYDTTWARPDEGKTILNMASGFACPNYDYIIRRQKYEINTEDQNGMTPLLNAISGLNFVNVKKLLSAGAYPNNNGTTTPLMYFLSAYSILNTDDNKNLILVDILEELLNAGASPDWYDPGKMCPLLFAVSYKMSPQIITLLVSHGAELTCEFNGEIYDLRLEIVEKYPQDSNEILFYTPDNLSYIPTKNMELHTEEPKVRLDAQCYDFVSMEETLVSELLTFPDSLIFMTPEEQYFCLTRQDLAKVMNKENYKYACTELYPRNPILSEMYCSLFGYYNVSVNDLREIRDNKSWQIFFIGGEKFSIKFTVDYQATTSSRNYVSANHCQDNTDLVISKIKRKN